jgi:hypothetical protein
MRGLHQHMREWLRRCCASWAIFVGLLSLWTAALLIGRDLHGFLHVILLIAVVQLVLRILMGSR